MKRLTLGPLSLSLFASRLYRKVLLQAKPYLAKPLS